MRSIIPRALTLLLVLFSILFVVMGLRWLVNPAGSAPQLGLTLETGAGLSSQVGDLSAFFLVAGLSGLIALLPPFLDNIRGLDPDLVLIVFSGRPIVKLHQYTTSTIRGILDNRTPNRNFFIYLIRLIKGFIHNLRDLKIIKKNLN